MKKYLKELVILLIQLCLFYLFPLCAGPTDAMGMVFISLGLTFCLSIVIGSISGKKIKYFYPLLIALLFIPSIWIYYNESALIHSVWYFTDSFIGIIIGSTIHKILK